MEYSIRELSQMAGVSARTLRYYDEIGLLKPLYVTEAGYRYYGEKEVDILQQILFYRERKFDLKSIKKMLCEDDFDRMRALEEHLAELEKQRDRLESLIGTVKQTISAMKGEWVMSDPEKFQAFKEKMVRENEEQYGREAREKYGDEEVDASNRNMLNMTENEWEHFQKLEREIRESLQDCVRKGVRADSEEAKHIVELHKGWLTSTWKRYSAEAHKGVAGMYVADERFRQYYDKEQTGCAEFLKTAIEFWADRM